MCSGSDHFFRSGSTVSTTASTISSSLRLADIQPGQTVVVTHVCCGFAIAARLMELGFVPGATVQVLRRAPFGGPVQYRVQGVSLTMRPDDARCVYVGGAGECDGDCGCGGSQLAEQQFVGV